MYRPYSKKNESDVSKTPKKSSVPHSITPDVMQQMQRTLGNQNFEELLNQGLFEEPSFSPKQQEGTVEKEDVIEMTQNEEVIPPISNEDVQLPYDYLFTQLEKIELTGEENNSNVIIDLLELKQSYDAAQGFLAKLKVADQISQKARMLSNPIDSSNDDPMQKVKRTLVKYPHVILGKEEKIRLEDMVDMMSEIDNSREIGLVNMVDAMERGSLGLFLGPKDPSLEGVGATVSAPGSSTEGFHGITSNFIAHTHPRAHDNQKPHSQELATDIEGAKSMEMVRDAYNSTFFYNGKGAKNKKSNDRFIDELKEPPAYKNIINSFTKKGHGQEYIDKIPTEEDRSEAVQEAITEGETIWSNVNAAKDKLSTNALTREEYLENLNIVDKGLFILEEGNLSTFEKWKEKFPVKNVDDEDGMSFLDFL